MATSEPIGIVLAIAVTLVVGAMAFSFTQQQAGVVEQSYANSAGSTNNALAEGFRILDMNFSSTTQSVYFWVYNTGRVNFQPLSVKLYDCQSPCTGQVNILYNFTVSGNTKTNRVYDLKAASSYYYSTCRLAGTTYESPTLSSVNSKLLNALLFKLTIPPTTTNCPSYGKTFASGTTYYISVTGLYGNVVTYYQVK